MSPKISRRLSEETRARLWLHQWRQGMTLRQIAEASGVGEWNVRRSLGREVTSKRPRGSKRLPIPPELVADMYRDLKSARAVARELQVSPVLVRDRLFLAGVLDRHPKSNWASCKGRLKSRKEYLRLWKEQFGSALPDVKAGAGR